jgi:amino-acid N-acetyltransferase
MNALHSKNEKRTVVRKAIISDVHHIHALLTYYGGKGVLLPRPLSELYDHIRDYFVAESDRTQNGILAVCALGVCWEDLAEIKSLAVSEQLQGKGVGSMLVEACLKEARVFGLKKVFVLTYVPDFFSRFGFQKVAKSLLPQKIWADCLKCTRFPNCDEVAMLLTLCPASPVELTIPASSEVCAEPTGSPGV